MISENLAKRWQRRTMLVSVIALGGVLSLASLANAGILSSHGHTRSIRGCAAFDDAADAAESSNDFDPNTGRFVVSTQEADYVMSDSDQTCRDNPRASARLAYARKVADENFRAMCEDFRKAVAENRTEQGGHSVNLDAARRALNGRCAQYR